MIALEPDAILFVGDLGDGDLKLIKSIKSLPFPIAVILGNHDRGVDIYGTQLEAQISLLGSNDCSWKVLNWSQPKISIVGGRPCSAGGGFYLSNQMKSVYGPVPIEESVKRIVNSAKDAHKGNLLIILAHSGPSGLGSNAASICGRDWKPPSCDWGDKDLEISIRQIEKNRHIDLVVFGHMHHKLKRGDGFRETFVRDKSTGISYLNAACVPRKFLDSNGKFLIHFSWVEFLDGKLDNVSHRWYDKCGSIIYKESLYSSGHLD